MNKFDELVYEVLNEGPIGKALATGALAAGLALGTPPQVLPAEQPAITQIAQKGIISDKLLDALAFMESNNNPNAVGDNGRALGLFQIWRGAWEQVEKDIPFNKKNAFNPKINRGVAKNYLQWIERTIAKNIGQQPTIKQIYVAWNRGYGKLRRDGYNVSKSPPKVQARARKLAALSQ